MNEEPQPIDVFCPYCNRAAVFTDSAEVYHGRSYGMIYLCRPCRAWVGVHKGTVKPLGRLADKTLRELKKNAHAALDPFWLDSPRAGRRQRRRQVCEWIGRKVGVEEFHVGELDNEQCRRVIKICLEARMSGEDPFGMQRPQFSCSTPTR